MSELQISVKPDKAAVLSGENFGVTTQLINKGEQTVEVCDLMGSSLVTYELRNPENGQAIYILSQKEANAAVSGDDVVPDMPPIMTALESNKVLTVTEDLAEYSLVPFRPGRYHLVAHYQFGKIDLLSEPIEVSINVPKIINFAQAFCPVLQTFSTAFTHRHHDESLWLYQRDSNSDLPGDGVFYRQLEFSADETISDLAVSVNTEYYGEGRWLAWIKNGEFSAAKAWGSAFTAMPEPIATGLGNVRLAGPGFTREDGSSVFIIVGLDNNNEVLMQQMVADDKNLRSGNKLPLCGKMPGKILTHYVSDNNGGRIFLFWSEKIGESNKIYYRSYSTRDWSGDNQPTLLYERKSDLLAFEIAPFTPDEPAQVHLLFGPEPPENPQNERERLFYITVALDNPKNVTESFRAVPEEPVREWAISSKDDGPRPIIARLADKILWTQLSGSGWQVLADRTLNVDFLSVLATLQGEYWAAWIDAMQGIRFEKIPCLVDDESGDDEIDEEEVEDEEDDEDDDDEEDED